MNPKYQLLAAQGKVFEVSGAQAGTTIAAGHVAPPAAGAATLLSILNPLSSQVNLEIIQTKIGHVSGTPGAGTFTYCHAYQGASITAAEAVAVKRALYLSQKATIALAWSATTLTGSVVHQVLSHLPSAPFAGALAATSEGTARSIVHDVDGMIVVPPGWMLTLAPAATGTTHIASVAIIYAEVANGNG
jgi:hypothetical protein